MGLSSFSPPHAFTIGTTTAEVGQTVIRVNDYALQLCTAVIANGHGQSWGTSIECEKARLSGKPVFVFGASEYSIYQWDYHCWAASLDEMLDVFGDWAADYGR